jgi:hypothetical protein
MEVLDAAASRASFLSIRPAVPVYAGPATYAFWTLGAKARTAAIWMFIAAGVVFVLSLGGFWHAWHMRRQSTEP